MAVGAFGVGRNPVALATGITPEALKVSREAVSEKHPRRLGLAPGVLAVADEVIEECSSMRFLSMLQDQ